MNTTRSSPNGVPRQFGTISYSKESLLTRSRPSALEKPRRSWANDTPEARRTIGGSCSVCSISAPSEDRSQCKSCSRPGSCCRECLSGYVEKFNSCAPTFFNSSAKPQKTQIAYTLDIHPPACAMTAESTTRGRTRFPRPQVTSAPTTSFCQPARDVKPTFFDRREPS